MEDLDVAIVGYGLAGRTFHSALIAATPGLRVATIVTGNVRRTAQARQDHPGVEVVAAVHEALDRAPGLAVVATANDSHADVAAQAIDRGIPVVVDKPLAPSVAQAQAVLDRARAAGVLLTVFHNRRWDTDQLTLRRLRSEGALGDVVRYESRFERWRPEPRPDAWRERAAPETGGGQLLDLGSHLVDQALVLFGPPTHVYAEVQARRGLAGDDDAFVALRHASGTISHLHMGAVMPAPGPRLRVQGTRAGFVVSGLDVQETALREGVRPGSQGWGMPAQWEHGRLVAGERSVPVPPVPGDWPRFYALLAQALRDGSPPPVDPQDGVATLAVIGAARRSAASQEVVAV